MSRLFISHSSVNNLKAVALKRWLAAIPDFGFGESEVFLDIEGGITAGERWQDALWSAVDRCEAVLFLISPAWLASKYCFLEFKAAQRYNKRIFGTVIEPVAFADIPGEMTAEWQLCDLTLAGESQSFDVSAKGQSGTVSFSAAGLNSLLSGLKRAGVAPNNFTLETGRAPYQGLKPLDLPDAAIFFGRDTELLRGLDRIRGMRAVGPDQAMTVLGASGAGKSSFLRAGLIRRLRRDDRNFFALDPVRPANDAISGETGMAAVLAASYAALRKPVTRGVLDAELRSGGDALVRRLVELRKLATARVIEPGKPVTVVLSIDQAEELCADAGRGSAENLLSILAAAFADPGLQNGGLLLLMTVRSDRHEALMKLEALRGLRCGTFALPAIADTSFRDVVTRPADVFRASGGKLDVRSDFVDAIVADAARGANALPLLAYTLERMFTLYGADGDLRLDEYETLGRMEGAIKGAVEAAIPAEDRPKLRQAFIPHLADVDPATRVPYRKRAKLGALSEESLPLIERMVGTRLLVQDQRDGETVVELAHDSLLSAWTDLKTWLQEDASLLARRARVEPEALDWESHGKASDRLLRAEGSLAEAETLLARPDLTNTAIRDYIAACRAKQDRAKRVRLFSLAGLAAAAVAAAVVFAVLYSQAQTAFEQTQAALDQSRRTQKALRHSSALAALGAGDAARAAALETNDTTAADASEVGPDTEGQRIATLYNALAAPFPKLLTGRFVAFAGRTVVTSELKEGKTRLLSFDVNGNTTKLIATAPGVFDKCNGVICANAAEFFSIAANKVIAAPNGFRPLKQPGSDADELPPWAAVAPLLVQKGEGPNTDDFDSGTIYVQSKGEAAPKDIGSFNADSEWGVVKAAFGPAGKKLLVTGFGPGDGSGTRASLFVQDGVPAAQLDGGSSLPSQWPDTIAFGDGDRLLATAQRDEAAVAIWNTDTGKLKFLLEGHDRQATSIAFGPGGRRIVTGSQDGSVRLYNGLTGSLMGVAATEADAVVAVDFDQVKGAFCAVWKSGKLAVWEVPTFRQVLSARLEGETFDGIGCQNQWLLAYNRSNEGRIRMWSYADDVSAVALARWTIPAGGILSFNLDASGSPAVEFLTGDGNASCGSRWVAGKGAVPCPPEGEQAAKVGESTLYDPELLEADATDPTASMSQDGNKACIRDMDENGEPRPGEPDCAYQLPEGAKIVYAQRQNGKDASIAFVAVDRDDRLFVLDRNSKTILGSASAKAQSTGFRPATVRYDRSAGVLIYYHYSSRVEMRHLATGALLLDEPVHFTYIGTPSLSVALDMDSNRLAFLRDGRVYEYRYYDTLAEMEAAARTAVAAANARANAPP